MAGIHKAARAAGVSDEQARSLFSSILTQVGEGERVYVKDFGTFSMRVSKARTIRSPQIPGGVAEIPERNVLKFQVSPSAKKALNGEQVETEAESEEEQTETETETEEQPEQKPAKAKAAAQTKAPAKKPAKK